MATWQFDIWLAELIGKIGNSYAQEEANLLNLRLLPDSIVQLIGDLPSEKSWNADLEIRGTMEGDRIDIIYENGSVAEISVRIDVREIDLNFLVRIVQFAKFYRLLLVNATTREVIESDIEMLIGTIERSPAFKFVSNPHDFIKKIELQRKRLV
jgi:hypothetical protein